MGSCTNEWETVVIGSSGIWLVHIVWCQLSGGTYHLEKARRNHTTHLCLGFCFACSRILLQYLGMLFESAVAEKQPIMPSVFLVMINSCQCMAQSKHTSSTGLDLHAQQSVITLSSSYWNSPCLTNAESLTHNHNTEMKTCGEQSETRSSFCWPNSTPNSQKAGLPLCQGANRKVSHSRWRWRLN